MEVLSPPPASTPSPPASLSRTRYMPWEILSEIFSHCDPDTLANVSLVSFGALESAAPFLYEEVVVRSFAGFISLFYLDQPPPTLRLYLHSLSLFARIKTLKLEHQACDDASSYYIHRDMASQRPTRLLRSLPRSQIDLPSRVANSSSSSPQVFFPSLRPQYSLVVSPLLIPTLHLAFSWDPQHRWSHSSPLCHSSSLLALLSPQRVHFTYLQALSNPWSFCDLSSDWLYQPRHPYGKHALESWDRVEKITIHGLTLRTKAHKSFFSGWLDAWADQTALVPEKELVLVLDFVGVATGIEAALGHWGGLKGFCEFNGMKELGGRGGKNVRVVLRVGEEDEERTLASVEEVRPFSVRKRMRVEVVRWGL